VDEEPEAGGRATRRPLRWVIGIAAVLALVHIALRYESDVGSFCEVCASERTVRQWGYAISERSKIWSATASEEIDESKSAKQLLGPDHVHTWMVWNNLYRALNGRSGAHPGIRMNPVAMAWRYNDRFRGALANFAEDTANRPLVELSFHLPGQIDEDSPNLEQEAAAVKAMVPLFVRYGQRVPDDWMRIASR
jgi:hypothetical protein